MRDGRGPLKRKLDHVLTQRRDKILKVPSSPSPKSRSLSKSQPFVAIESNERSPFQLSYQNEISPLPIFQPQRFAKEMRAFTISLYSGEHLSGPLQNTGDTGMRYFFRMNWPQIESVYATNQHFLRMKAFLTSRRLRTLRPLSSTGWQIAAQRHQ